MAQSYLMAADQFEQQKNIKAGGFTAGVCLLITLLLVLVSWKQPKIVPPDPPLDQQGIEVNLGTDETGSGDDQPELPGDPAPQIASAPAQTTANDAADDNTSDDPESTVTTSKTEKPKVTTKPAEDIKKTTVNTKPVTNPTPAPPKPKAVFNGKTAPNSNGTGGNGADTYKPGSNQGIAGGKGDQGKPGGDPNSDSYTGNGKGNGGINISKGLSGRRITSLPNFEDEFNQNATVYVDVVVNSIGSVTSATINPKGTTTTNNNIRQIALRKAKQLKFNTSSEDQQSGTLIFNFKLKG